MRQTVAILGIPIDRVDMASALDIIRGYVESGGFHQVATANTDFLVRAQSDPELRVALRTADLVVADGMPVVQAARWLGSPLPERVAGADLVPLLARQAARCGHRLYLLGARQEVAAEARRRLEAQNPGLQVVGQVSPPLAPVAAMDHEALLRDIEARQPDILLVAFGNPKQEKWIHMHRQRLRVPVCIGIGGSLDFIAGATRRAPLWMQRTGLEWLHRVTREPGRLWRRYATDAGVFGRRIAGQLRGARPGATPGSVSAGANPGSVQTLSVSGTLGKGIADDVARLACEGISGGSDVCFDLSGVDAVDSAGMGALLSAAGCGRHHGRSVTLRNVTPRVRSVLEQGYILEALPEDGQGEAGAFAVDVVVSDAAGTVTASGRADLYTAHSLERALETLPGDVRSACIDLRAATYVDSAALAVALRAASVKERSVTVAANPVVRSAVTLGGLDGRLALVSAPGSPAARPNAVEV